MTNGLTHVLVVVCALTKFTLYIPVRTTRGKDTFDALFTHVFCLFGTPLVVLADNGTAFANDLMQASATLFGYRMLHVLPYNPQANGVAEAAVKKLKLAFDKHTDGYRDWPSLCPIIQFAVNTRTTNRLQSPFSALFGYEPVTLSALEQPGLLPIGDGGSEHIRQLAHRLKAVHCRIRTEVEDLKRLTQIKAPEMPRQRAVAAGDTVWLKFASEEKALYLRKHGHGKAWRHPFKVLDVKPHAVLLDVPKDGSAPEVLPWQSLRKCSLAPPHFHDPELAVPDVDEHGLPLLPELHDEATDGIASTPEPADSMGWDLWEQDPKQDYQIERIVGAEQVGGGWRLRVKWVGYPEPTPEPLYRILQQTNHPDVLADIERCKADHLLLKSGGAVNLVQSLDTDDHRPNGPGLYSPWLRVVGAAARLVEE